MLRLFGMRRDQNPVVGRCSSLVAVLRWLALVLVSGVLFLTGTGLAHAVSSGCVAVRGGALNTAINDVFFNGDFEVGETLIFTLIGGTQEATVTPPGGFLAVIGNTATFTFTTTGNFQIDLTGGSAVTTTCEETTSEKQAAVKAAVKTLTEMQLAQSLSFQGHLLTELTNSFLNENITNELTQETERVVYILEERRQRLARKIASENAELERQIAFHESQIVEARKTVAAYKRLLDQQAAHNRKIESLYQRRWSPWTQRRLPMGYTESIERQRLRRTNGKIAAARPEYLAAVRKTAPRDAAIAQAKEKAKLSAAAIEAERASLSEEVERVKAGVGDLERQNSLRITVNRLNTLEVRRDQLVQQIKNVRSKFDQRIAKERSRIAPLLAAIEKGKRILAQLRAAEKLRQEALANPGFQSFYKIATEINKVLEPSVAALKAEIVELAIKHSGLQSQLSNGSAKTEAEKGVIEGAMSALASQQGAITKKLKSVVVDLGKKYVLYKLSSGKYGDTLTKVENATKAIEIANSQLSALPGGQGGALGEIAAGQANIANLQSQAAAQLQTLQTEQRAVETETKDLSGGVFSTAITRSRTNGGTVWNIPYSGADSGTGSQSFLGQNSAALNSIVGANSYGPLAALRNRGKSDGVGAVEFFADLNSLRRSRQKTNGVADDDMAEIEGLAAYLNTQSGQPGAAQPKYNVWSKGEYSDSESDQVGADREAQSYSFATGAYFVPDEKLMVGGMYRYRSATSKSVAQDSDVSTKGHGVGVHSTLVLTSTLSVSGQMLYERSDNEIDRGGVTGSFGADQYVASGTLQGSYRHNGWWLRPAIGITYAHVDSEAFHDSSGTRISGQITEQGQMTFGPSFGTRIWARDSWGEDPWVKYFDPSFSMTGIWSFMDEGDTTLASGTIIEQDSVSAQINAALSMLLRDNSTLSVNAGYAGFGDSQVETFSFGGKYSIPLGM